MSCPRVTICNLCANPRRFDSFIISDYFVKLKERMIYAVAMLDYITFLQRQKFQPIIRFALREA